MHLDFIGFSASVLCALHCAALPFLLTLAPLAGLRFLDNPWLEYAIILLSFFIAANALTHGYRRHHKKLNALVVAIVGFVFIAIGQLSTLAWTELFFTSSGGIIIAVAHLINWKYIRRSELALRETSSHHR